MRLSRDDQLGLVDRLKSLDIQLSYEEILHKKVPSDMYAAIPNGDRLVLWFTSHREGAKLFVFVMGNRNEVKSVTQRSGCFSSSLALGRGTILFGYTTKKEDLSTVACIDVPMYKGTDLIRSAYGKRLEKLAYLLNNESRQVRFTKNCTVLGAPVIERSLFLSTDGAKRLPYDVSMVMMARSAGVCGFLPVTIRRERTAVFEVRPRTEEDIYELFCSDSGAFPHSLACVQTYKMSVKLNRLFRKVKENDNLDLLEESDDEDEFEDPSDDKFVYLDRAVRMKCVFNRRFKRWEPTDALEETARVCSLKQIKSLEDEMKISVFKHPRSDRKAPPRLPRRNNARI